MPHELAADPYSPGARLDSARAASGAPALAGAAYIPGIDGLRALAVLSVMLFHFAPGLLPGGFSGVDVFFVVSGYVVSGSLAAERTTTFKAFTLAFYARRVMRIYPALLVCLVVTGLMQTLLVPSSWLSTTSEKTGLFAFFGLSNFALTGFDDGYFSPRTEFNTFTHTWSLAVEEQFYLLFPAVFFAWLTWRVRTRPWRAAALVLLPTMLAVSLALCWYQTRWMPAHAYYWLPARFWELACGAMLFQLHAQNRLVARSPLQGNASILAGLALIGAGFLFSDPKSFPFPWALPAVAGTLLAIAGVQAGTQSDLGGRAAAGAWLGRLLDNRLSVYIGKLSYSLYLWHWPIAVIFRWTTGLQGPLVLASATALTVLASALSYHFVERPIRQSKSLKAKSEWAVVSRGLMAMCVGAMLVLCLFKAQSHLSLSVTRDRANWYPENWPSPAASAHGAGLKGRRLFVLGDSHTGAYSTLLQMLMDRQGLAVRQESKGGCAVAGLLERAGADCAAFAEQSVANVVAAASPGDVVFLASLRMNRLGDQWGELSDLEAARRQSGPEAAESRAAALREADALITRLEGAGLTVLIDAPMPVFKSPPFRCSDWFNRHNPVCAGGESISRGFLLERRQPVMDSLAKLARAHPGLVVWDPLPLLCPKESCTALDGKLPLFFDGDHLSAHGNRVLYPSFLSELQAIWPTGGKD